MANKMFVGGLSWNTTDELLRDCFAKHGEVTEAKVVTDRDTGRSRGFGFVTMANADEMNVAIRVLDGTMLDGRAIRVSQAQDRAGGGGGGGGGGDRFGGGGGGRHGGGGGGRHGGGGGGKRW
ncbi:MAG: RNA-binding protein [Deltaproteobacteria bacterium]|nr:RNA-binding protein [Deltaproteobacteria bacterium]MBK8239343.1 RNA-binding protein [Deltaproteobacteria bacterium]MBK8719582.1 RNA-binding protein [Deltaproteobacteria bacterium]MBP7291488.1 RNA-binding protein [Nannocystaceae bacterium]